MNSFEQMPDSLVNETRRGGCGGRFSKSRNDSKKVGLIKAKKLADAEYFSKVDADREHETEMKKFYAPVDKRDRTR